MVSLTECVLFLDVFDLLMCCFNKEVIHFVTGASNFHPENPLGHLKHVTLCQDSCHFDSSKSSEEVFHEC